MPADLLCTNHYNKGDKLNLPALFKQYKHFFEDWLWNLLPVEVGKANTNSRSKKDLEKFTDHGSTHRQAK